jgi:hypothetical protein
MNSRVLLNGVVSTVNTTLQNEVFLSQDKGTKHRDKGTSDTAIPDGGGDGVIVCGYVQVSCTHCPP